MNNKQVYHCDIKESNVLASIDKSRMFAKLIDWGISAHYTGKKKIPPTMVGRPFQYNTPFSTVLFNKHFIQMYKNFLKTTPNPDDDAIAAFVNTYVLYWVNRRGIGHLKSMNTIFKNVDADKTYDDMQYFGEDILKYQHAYSYIFKYLTDILIEYTNKKSKKMELLKYFTEVYLKNIDVWGFTMIYLPIMEYLQYNLSILNRYELKIVETIKKMILLLVENSAEPIDIAKLMVYIAKLPDLFTNANTLREQGPVQLVNSKKKVKIPTKIMSTSS